MRAALYTRVSTKDGRQETANQLNQLREYCAHNGWPIVFEYEDHESGSKLGRPQFQRLMTDASQRRFDVVLFWALDRFTREGALATLQHLEQLTS